LHLSPDDIAAAEACGVSFLPASDAQVQRLAMQRKVFYQAGRPILATRGDGFFETVGTLQQLIDEGRQQQRDLAQWLQAEAAASGVVEVAAAPGSVERVAPEVIVISASVEAVAAVAEPAPLPAAAAISAMTAAEEDTEAPPKRTRQRRSRPAVIPWVDPAEAEPVAVPVPAEADTVAERVDSTVRSAARPDTASLSAEERGKRWLMAGAARRGRAGKHWSTRQR
jgi:hypothetical protein